MRKFCVKRIYKKIPGQKKFCGDSSDAFVLYQWAKNKKSHSIHKQLGTSNFFRKEKLSSNCCKKSEGVEENNNAGSGKRQPRSRAPAVGMEFAERKKKPKTTSNKGWRKQRNKQKRFLPVRWRGNHGLRLRISSVIIGSIIHQRHICCTRLSPPPPYNLTKYEELEEATLKPDAMARTRWSACGSHNPKTHFTTHPTKKTKKNKPETTKNSSSPSLSFLVFCFVGIVHPHTHITKTLSLLFFPTFLCTHPLFLGIHDLYLQITALLSLSTKTPENTQTSFYCLPSSLIL